jgi:hypothetical protein
MDEIDIALHEDKTAYAPGETLQGTLRWNLQAPVRSLDLSLLWYTSGKGTRDVGVFETQTFESPGLLGSKDFAIKLPEGPYSFSGRLISLIWAIEVTCVPEGPTQRQEIVLSPTGREITLGQGQ